MQSIPDGPALAFEDFMHSPSPSPTPQSRPAMAESIAHRVLENADAKQSFYVSSSESPVLPDYRENGETTAQLRLQGLGLLDAGGSASLSLTAREAELVNLVLQSTSLTNGHVDQLAAQAETISALIQQRKFLVDQREDERNRWTTERENWQRSMEVLVAKRRVIADGATIDQETQRRLFFLESDNKSLKQKLTESQQRVVLLEGELNRLRPLLLSQPIDDLNHDVVFPIPSSHTPKPPAQKRKTKRDKETDVEREKGMTEKREREREAGEIEKRKDGEEKDGKEIDVPVDVAATGVDKQRSAPVPIITEETQTESTRSHGQPPATQPQTSGSQHYRLLKEREAQAAQFRKSAKHARATTRGTSSAHSTLLADARNEVLLNAVRKFGRLKAGLYAGFIKTQGKSTTKDHGPGDEQGRDKEKEREPRKRTRKPTVQKDASGAQSQLPLETPGAGPSNAMSSVVVDHPASPNPTAAGVAHIAVHAGPPHVTPIPQSLHPSVQHSAHPTHQFVYISPVQASGRTFIPTMQSIHTNPNSVPMYVSYWPAQPGTPLPGMGTATPITPVAVQRTAEKTTRTRQRGRRRKDALETVQNGSATPMDSLVSAARTMLVEDEEVGVDEEDGTDGKLGPAETVVPVRGATGGRKRRRGGRVGGPDAGSPQPKRRRVANTIPTSLHPSTLLATPHKGGPPPHSHTLAALVTPAKGQPPSRTRSALDVLADTAQEQERRLSTDNADSRRQSPEPRSTSNGTAHFGAVTPTYRRGKQRAAKDPEDEISTRSRSMSTDSHIHPIDFRHITHRTLFDDRGAGESEISEDDSDSEPSLSPSVSQPSLPRRVTNFYKPRKALHQYQFVPPSPESVRTSARKAARASADEHSPTRGSGSNARNSHHKVDFERRPNLTAITPGPGTGSPAVMRAVRAGSVDPDVNPPRNPSRTLLPIPPSSDLSLDTDWESPVRVSPESSVTVHRWDSTSQRPSSQALVGASEAIPQLLEPIPSLHPGVHTDLQGSLATKEPSGSRLDLDAEHGQNHSAGMPVLDNPSSDLPNTSGTEVTDNQ